MGKPMARKIYTLFTWRMEGALITAMLLLPAPILGREGKAPPAKLVEGAT